jgi:polar amino acid transport system substrate-binding protein
LKEVKDMKLKLLVAVAAVVGLLPSSASPQPPKAAALQLGATPWSPFTDSAGKARFAIDLVHRALKRAGVSAETAIVADGTLTPALLAKRFHGSPAMWRDQDRDKDLIFSKPYLENRLVLLGKRGADVSAPSLGALFGKRISIVNGYAYGDALPASNGPTFVPATTVEDSLQQVLSGKADYALIDALVVEYLVNTYPAEVKSRLAIGTIPMVVKPLHFALRRDVPGAQSIIDRFNAELTRMIADRSYHVLLHVAWITADADGDGRMELVPATDRAGQAPPVHRYELVTVTASSTDIEPPTKLRFYLGGKVYEDWGSVPEQYKKIEANKTPWGSQVAPLFSFKW